MAAKKEKTVKKLTRREYANQVVSELKGSTTLSALAEEVDRLVVEAGSDSNIKAAAWDVKRSLETAEMFGLVKLTRPTDILVERSTK